MVRAVRDYIGRGRNVRPQTELVREACRVFPLVGYKRLSQLLKPVSS